MSLFTLMRRLRTARILRYALLQALGAACIVSQTIAIEFDPARAKIEFTLPDVLHTIHGTFKLKSGHLNVNPENNTISGAIVVDAASGESGNGIRDRRMKKSILETDRYPEIIFAPNAIDGKVSGGFSSANIGGGFQIHGQRHQISIPMQIRMYGDEVFASGRFVVPYVAWGMKNPSTFILRVDEKVDIEFTAMGRIVRNSPSGTFKW